MIRRDLLTIVANMSAVYTYRQLGLAHHQFRPAPAEIFAQRTRSRRLVAYRDECDHMVYQHQLPSSCADGLETIIRDWHVIMSYYALDVQHGKIVEWYPSGRIQCRGWFDRGLMSGEWLQYYESGQLHERHVFMDRMARRAVTTWYESGILRTRYGYQTIDGETVVVGNYANQEHYDELGVLMDGCHCRECCHCMH